MSNLGGYVELTREAKEDVEYATKKLGEVKKLPNDECLKCG